VQGDCGVESGLAAEVVEMEGGRQEWGVRGIVRKYVMCLRRPYWYPASGSQHHHIEFRKTLPRRNFLMSRSVGQLAEDFASFEGSDREGMAWEVVGQTEKHRQH